MCERCTVQCIDIGIDIYIDIDIFQQWWVLCFCCLHTFVLFNPTFLKLFSCSYCQCFGHPFHNSMYKAWFHNIFPVAVDSLNQRGWCLRHSTLKIFWYDSFWPAPEMLHHMSDFVVCHTQCSFVLFTVLETSIRDGMWY
jgi:hypothetical protein